MNIMQSLKNQSRPHTVTPHESRPLALIVSLCVLGHCYGQGTMTFTFEGAPLGTVQNVGVYYESGMSFGATPGNVVLNGGGISGYPDDGTGYLQMPDGNVDFFFTPTRYFNLVSLDLAAYNTSAPFPGTFEVVGNKGMAGMVTNYFTLTTPLPGFQTFNLDSSFVNVFQVDIFGAMAPFSLDNVVISGVPEPSCGALVVLATVCGLGRAWMRGKRTQ